MVDNGMIQSFKNSTVNATNNTERILYFLADNYIMQKRHILNWRILVVAAFIFLLYDASNGFTIMSFLNDSFLLSFFKLTGFITASPSTGFGGGSSSAIDIL